MQRTGEQSGTVAGQTALMLLAIGCLLAGVHFEWVFIFVGLLLFTTLVLVVKAEQYLWLIFIMVNALFGERFLAHALDEPALHSVCSNRAASIVSDQNTSNAAQAAGWPATLHRPAIWVAFFALVYLIRDFFFQAFMTFLFSYVALRLVGWCMAGCRRITIGLGSGGCWS